MVSNKEGCPVIQVDYQKAFTFAKELCDETGDFAGHVLALLHKYYGAAHATFVPASYTLPESGSLYAQPPSFFGMSQRCIREYTGRYMRYDPFMLHNLPRPLIGSPVLMMSDIPDYQKNRVLYNEFLHKNNFRDHMCVYLYVGEHCLGGICIYRETQEQPFQSVDKSTMEELSRIIAKQYFQTLSHGMSSYQKMLYKSLFDDMNAGTIIVDTDFQVLDYNRAAEEHSRRILADEAGAGALQLPLASDSITQIVQHVSASLKGGTARELSLSAGSRPYRVSVDTLVVPTDYFAIKPVYIIRVEPAGNSQHQLDGSGLDSYGLTPREKEIVRLVVQGHSNQKIADLLGISLHTSKTHMKSIFSKMGVSNRAELAYRLYADQQDWVSPMQPPPRPIPSRL